jgi:hypothetical protein
MERVHHPADDPQVWSCADKWHRNLTQQGISDVGPGDLVHEAWLNARPHLESGKVTRPVPYLCSAVRTAALGRMRRHRQLPVYCADPFESALALRAIHDRSYEEVDAVLSLAQTLQFVADEGPAMWSRLLNSLGSPERPDAVWAAAVCAVKALLSGEVNPDGRAGGWSLKEVMVRAMQRTDAYWRPEPAPGESMGQALDRLRKRIRRDLPWISYLAVWETLRHAMRDDAEACRAMAAQHNDALQILLREWRSRPDRLAALEAHVTEVRRSMD